MITVQWPQWSKIVNKTFIPLINNKDRYVILVGGRGSGKSDFAAKKLIYRCLNDKYFRCVLIRQTYNSIKDSSYQTIKDIIIDLGLDELFDFKLQPLEIVCKENGNKFIARGLDDTTKLKSIKDPTCAYYEEDIPSEEDFITITTSIRTQKADYLQELFTINPEVEGNYEEHWFYKRFFAGHSEKSFNDITKIQIDEDRSTTLTYTVHHSTYLDNRWLPNSFMGYLIELAKTNPYYYTIYCLGQWGNKVSGDLFYNKFNIGKNIKEIKYDQNIPLHISFDFNTIPYMSLTIFQVYDKEIYCIDEITTKDPHNNTRDLCKYFLKKYSHHIGGLFIYGDPSGRHEDTRSEKGFNDYKIIEQELLLLRPSFRIASSAPPVKMRGDFINDIFESSWGGLNLYISNKCNLLIADFMNGKAAPDGTKLKKKIDGYEKYHHLDDSLDYFICECFKSDFSKYMRGPTPIERVYINHTTSSKHRL